MLGWHAGTSCGCIYVYARPRRGDDVRAPAASRIALAQQRSNCLLSSHIASRPLALTSPASSSRCSAGHHHATTSQDLFGLMGRHAGVVLLVLMVVLLLVAASDGSRPAPAAGGASDELAHGSTAEMVVAAPSSPAQGRRSRSRSRAGGKDDDLVLREEAVRVTVSSLPDCSHACGACSPCSRVMVSFKCSASEPMPCPMVYRCMCRGKCYPVPSS